MWVALPHAESSFVSGLAAESKYAFGRSVKVCGLLNISPPHQWAKIKLVLGFARAASTACDVFVGTFPKYLRSELKETAERLATRNYKLDVEKLTKLEEMRKDLMVRTQDLQAKRNSMSKSIGQAKREGKDITEIKNEASV